MSSFWNSQYNFCVIGFYKHNRFRTVILVVLPSIWLLRVTFLNFLSAFASTFCDFLFQKFQINFIFSRSFALIAKLSTRYRDFPHTPFPHIYANSLSTFHSRAKHLLQLMSLQWHIIITQSPWFTLGFTFGAVHSMGFEIHNDMYP